jgi:hypothetical protein
MTTGFPPEMNLRGIKKLIYFKKVEITEAP